MWRPSKNLEKKFACLFYLILGATSIAVIVALSVDQNVNRALRVVSDDPALAFGVAGFCCFLLAGKGIVNIFGCIKRGPPPRTVLSAGTPHTQPLPTDGVPALGLSTAQAEALLQQHGRNELPSTPGKPLWYAVLDEVHEPQQKLLLVVAVLYCLFGQVEDGVTALVVIALMVAAEVVTEWRAKNAIAALADSAPRFARVVRDGCVQSVRRQSVVPGDLVLLRRGDEVPADGLLLSSSQLHVNESKLTGESVPVMKGVVPAGLPRATPLAERVNVVYTGTVVTRGKATVLVTGTGQATELGQVHMATQAQLHREKRTPLQTLLRSVAGRLTYVALAASLLGGLLGLVRRQAWQAIVLTALSLAFATIPEELPILIAAVLAVGALALSRSSVYVKRLRAMEALAYVDTVLTDKTGTITNNRMAVTHDIRAVQTATGTSDGIELRALAASQAALPPSLECLLVGAMWMGDGEGLQTRQPGQAAAVDAFDAAIREALSMLKMQPRMCRVLYERPFEQDSKLAWRVVETPDGPQDEEQAHRTVVYLSGAPEAVLGLCDRYSFDTSTGGRVAYLDRPAQDGRPSPRQRLLDTAAEAAKRGLRMVAYARSVIPYPFEPSRPPSSPPSTCILLGVLCFRDQLRSDVPAAVAQARRAGIDVVMVTGDHPAAAATIAQEAGILSHPGVDEHAVPVAGHGRPSPAHTHTRVVHCGQAEEQAGKGIPGRGVGGEGGDSHAVPSWCSDSVADHCRVFARATPLHKLQLVHAMKAAGRTIIATGDGVNDAPALAAADVGIAVQDATDVARDAASIVIVRSDFTALLQCISGGRRLSDNLTHALAFYLGAKLGLVTLFIVGTVWRGFPLSPVQVIVSELFMDLGASTSFVAEPAVRGILDRRPKDKKAPFFDKVMMVRIGVGGLCMASTVLAGLAYGTFVAGPQAGQAANDDAYGRGAAFVTWLVAHVSLAYNQRTATEPVLISKPLGGNLAFGLWALGVAVLCGLMGGVQTLGGLLGMPHMQPVDWAVLCGIAIAGTWWIELVKLLLAGTARATTTGAAHPHGRAAKRAAAGDGVQTGDATAPLLENM